MAGFVRPHETNFMNDKAFVNTNILVYARDLVSGIKNAPVH